MFQIAASRSFTIADQTRFAAVSGDANPMHVDAVAARRVGAGAPVVHGVHNLLWCLDSVAHACPAGAPIESLRVDFASFVVVGEPVEAWLVQADGRGMRAEVRLRGNTVLTVLLGFGDKRSPDPPARTNAVFAPDAPLDPPEADIAAMAGVVPFATPPETISAAFPAAARLLGPRRVAALGACTRLIGMVCPGLHSVFNRIALDAAGDDGRDEIGFAVAGAHLERRRVQVSVSGGGWTGSLVSMMRHRPTAQLSMREIGGLVAAGAFRDSVALVVGGSRGMGEVAAKIIAAGGGRAIVTYATGEADARRVAAEIGDWGGIAEVARLDIREPVGEQLAGMAGTPNRLLYFPTPMIARRGSALFDANRLAEFIRFYVTGFHECYRALIDRGPRFLTALYPSSVFVEDRPAGVTEYAMAKAAGEQLCRDMNEGLSSFRVIVSRFPRLATDQNPGLSEGPSIATVLLPLIAEMGREEPRAVLA